MKPIEFVKKLNLDEEEHNIDPLKQHLQFWNRIIELASLARTINPDLPNVIRGYKETSFEDPLSESFTLYLTKNTNEKFTEITDDDIPLFEALEETLPDYIFYGENNLLHNASPYNFKGPIEAIIYHAYRDLAVKIHSENFDFDPYDMDANYDMAGKHVYTSPVTVPQYYYQNNPHFERDSYFITEFNDENKEFRALNNKRKMISEIKNILSHKFSEVSEEQKNYLKESYDALNGRRYDQTFEVKHSFSLIGYALNNNTGKEADNWIKFLSNDIGCDLSATYGANKVDLLTLAIVRNSDTLIELLTKNNQSVLKVYPELPPILDKDVHNALFRNFTDSYLSSLTLASAWGSDKVVKKLLEDHAYPDTKTSLFRTAAHYAAFNNDEKILTLLVSHGADLNTEDVYKAIPSERIPQSEEGNKLFSKVEEWRLNESSRPSVKSKKENDVKSILSQKSALKEKLSKSTSPKKAAKLAN